MALVAKNFQDIITFSRASSGTYVNNNGYITNSSVLNYLTQSNAPETAAWTKSNSFVQQNLVLWSEDFTNALWLKGQAGVGFVPVVTANQGIAPDGTLTADRVDFNCAGSTNTDRSYMFQTVTSTSGVPYASSYYIKAFDTASVGKTIRYTIETGASSQEVIITLTADWQRVSNIFPAAGAGYNAILETRGTVTSSATASVLLWGAQVVQGSTIGDYRATTSAALPCLYADYNGALRARKLCEDNATSSHSLYKVVTVNAGAVYTASVRLKAAERNFAQFRYENGGATNVFLVDINLSTGAYTTGTFGAPTSTSATVTPESDGYWKVSITAAASNTTFVAVVFVQSVLGANTYTGNGSSGIYIADAQLNDGSSALAYYDSTGSGSAYNAPRFDYDPVTLEAKGLLVEEIRANLLLQSNDFQTSWTQINITRTLNSILSPSGNVDGVKLTATASAVTTEVQGATVAATAATGSVYVKQGTGATTANLFALRNQTTLTDLIVGSLNYSTGVFTYTTGSTGVVVTNAGNGWWRIALSATTGITSGDTMRLYVGFPGIAQTAGDFLYAYGAQLEAGAFATSYIPTVASQVTRAADLAGVDTMSPWFNASEGTFYLDFSCFGYNATLYPCAAQLGVRGTGSRGYIHVLNGPSASTSFNIFNDAFVFQGVSHSPTYTIGARRKQAGAYAVNNAASSLDGTGTVVDTSVTLPTGINTLAIGVYASYGSNQQINGHIKRITYYPRRLSNAELQTLTTL